ncbi:MAG: ABC transporter ATP-binding protein [Deltaproteobacteria bacterium]|nr:ABC transporter ATP-binding protein [Deltaproteobacteria bacterium]
MIRLEDIWRTFVMGDQSLHALQAVTETFAAGEHVAIIGPSGSGKSTLLNILGCLDKPTRGQYFFDGRAIESLDPDELAQLRLNEIGFIFQAFHLVPRLDATANIELPMTLAGVARKERSERARAALESVGLGDRAGHRPAELSGGQKQRVAIARAISMQPRLLLADEPTGNLDTHSGEQILDLLDGLNQEGITLAVVTHDPEVARRAQRVLEMRDGEIVRRISADEVSDANPIFDRGRVGKRP